MAKTHQKNFRLSEAALANLAAICRRSGVNETAAVEMSLAALAVGLTHEQPASVFARHQADFHWDESNLVWCLSGVDKQGASWQTQNFGAQNQAQAEVDAAQYLLNSKENQTPDGA